MKSYPGKNASTIEGRKWNTKKIRAITSIALEFEVHPTPNERECNCSRQQTSPHDQKVRQPTPDTALEDEALCDEIQANCLGRVRGVLKKLVALAEEFP